MVIILLALDNQVKEEENREVDLEEVEEDQRRLRFKKIPDFNDWDCTNFTLYFPWVPGQFSLDQKSVLQRRLFLFTGSFLPLFFLVSVQDPADPP